MIYLDIMYNELFCSMECNKAESHDEGERFNPNRLIPIHASDYEDMRCYNNKCRCGKDLFNV